MQMPNVHAPNTKYMLERSRTQIYISQIPIVGIQSVLPDIQSSASHELALFS